MTSPPNLDRPALLGGSPVRPQGPPVWPPADEAIIAAIVQAARDGAWGQYLGPRTDELRQILREFHAVEYVWLCSSGTAAVELALRGLGVGPGDEVILAAYDFKANFTDILALGALPVLVDLRPDDWHLNVELVAAAITPRTKAVLASHLHGGSVRMSDLRGVLEGRSIGLLEDSCQCPGVMIDGRISGTSGDVGVLSFGGTKLTAAGRGGAVLSNRQDIVERIKRHVMRGNDLSPLSELEAAALVPQWRMLPEWNERRVENVRILTGLLAEFPGLRMLTVPTSRTTSGFYKVGFEYDVTKMSGLSRESFCRAMQAEGVAFSPGFRGLHRIHASRRFQAAGPLPVADVVHDRIVVLHHPVLLDGVAEMREIANAARKVGVFAEELSRQPIPAFSRPEDFDE